MNLQEQISRMKSMMGLLAENQSSFVDEFGNVFNFEFDRPNWDINKLVDVGAVFVVRSVDGDPNSPNYGKPIEGQGNSLLSLENYEKSLEQTQKTGKEDWIKIAVENYQTSPTTEDQNTMDSTYENKINQIRRSLERLGIDENNVKKDFNM